MNPTTSTIAGCLMGTLAMTMMAPASSVAKTPDPLMLSDFSPKPGQICTYDIVHNGKKVRWNSEVSDVSGDGLKAVWTQVGTGVTVAVPFVDVRTASGIKLTADLNMVHGTPMTAEPGIQTVAFPLAPKKKWKGTSVVSGTDARNQPWKVSSTFYNKAGRWKKVKTPAGDTMALVIAMRETINGLSASFKGKGLAKTWIGRGGCPVKKYKYSNTFNQSASMILISEQAP
jgi:hypothetical protein